MASPADTKLAKHPTDLKEIERLHAEGLQCVLWDQSAADLEKFDLIVFIGFLNELLCLCAKRQGPYAQKGA